MKTEQFCIRCGMSNLEIDGYNNCNVYGNNYGKHDFEPMNKLHEALKNEELMLEVGRKATEEQKAMTQSTIEFKNSMTEFANESSQITVVETDGKYILQVYLSPEHNKAMEITKDEFDFLTNIFNRLSTH